MKPSWPGVCQLLFPGIALQEWFSHRGSFALRGHGAMSGDSLVVTDGGWYSGI